MTRHKVVLYNPRAVFYTMPLALLAVGSHVDPRRYQVRIVDGRLERDPIGAVLAEIDDAMCLGVTVLTGAPIRDAIAVTRAVRARRPHLPIVWGGWHPSLLPQETRDQAGVDAVVVGQGEETFADILDRLAACESLAGVSGCAVRSRSADGSDRTVVNASRPMRELSALAPHDYELIAVDRYFALKGQRQLDYISSQGCRFRCTFCADPYVYQRAWTGLEPSRMGHELEWLWRRHHFNDVGFQDETFFTSAQRVAAIADEFLRRDLRFTWMATMRADQGVRIDEQLLAQCKRAGLRRVMIGVEAGSQGMLDWMKKDIKIEQIFESGDRCQRQGLAVLFNFIVGFPDEPAESVAATLRVAKRLRARGPDFQVAIFYYKPYPGNEIADALARQGYSCPSRLEEWADFDDVASSSPWVDRHTQRLIEGFKFYQRIGWAKRTPLRAPIQALARWRCQRDLYAWPIEKALLERLRPSAQLS